MFVLSINRAIFPLSYVVQQSFAPHAYIFQASLD